MCLSSIILLFVCLSNKVSISNNVKPFVSGTKTIITIIKTRLKLSNTRKVWPAPKTSRKVGAVLLFTKMASEKIEHDMDVDNAFTFNGSNSPISAHGIGVNPKL